jgi:uncharacterized protein (DUF1697 family)
MNASMPALKACFEKAGFSDVRTVLSSGNVVFSARAASEAALERKAEAAMAASLGRKFMTIVRPVAALRALIARDPHSAFRLPAQAKRVVTFVRKPARAKLALPLEVDGARILTIEGREIFTAYVPSPRGAVFMQLIERTFGTEVTTRTLDTVRKLAR